MPSSVASLLTVALVVATVAAASSACHPFQDTDEYEFPQLVDTAEPGDLVEPDTSDGIEPPDTTPSDGDGVGPDVSPTPLDVVFVDQDAAGSEALGTRDAPARSINEGLDLARQRLAAGDLQRVTLRVRSSMRPYRESLAIDDLPVDIIGGHDAEWVQSNEVRTTLEGTLEVTGGPNDAATKLESVVIDGVRESVALHVEGGQLDVHDVSVTFNGRLAHGVRVDQGAKLGGTSLALTADLAGESEVVGGPWLAIYDGAHVGLDRLSIVPRGDVLLARTERQAIHVDRSTLTTQARLELRMASIETDNGSFGSPLYVTDSSRVDVRNVDIVGGDNYQTSYGIKVTGESEVVVRGGQIVAGAADPMGELTEEQPYAWGMGLIGSRLVLENVDIAVTESHHMVGIRLEAPDSAEINEVSVRGVSGTNSTRVTPETGIGILVVGEADQNSPASWPQDYSSGRYGCCDPASTAVAIHGGRIEGFEAATSYGVRITPGVNDTKLAPSTCLDGTVIRGASLTPARFDDAVTAGIVADHARWTLHNAVVTGGDGGTSSVAVATFRADVALANNYLRGGAPAASGASNEGVSIGVISVAGLRSMFVVNNIIHGGDAPLALAHLSTSTMNTLRMTNLRTPEPAMGVDSASICNAFAEREVIANACDAGLMLLDDTSVPPGCDLDALDLSLPQPWTLDDGCAELGTSGTRTWRLAADGDLPCSLGCVAPLFDASGAPRYGDAPRAPGTCTELVVDAMDQADTFVSIGPDEPPVPIE